MQFMVTPVTGSVAGGVSAAQFTVYGGIVTCILILALILKELWSTQLEEKPHHHHTVHGLNIVIYPLLFVFAIIVVYKIVEVL